MFVFYLCFYYCQFHGPDVFTLQSETYLELFLTPLLRPESCVEKNIGIGVFSRETDPLTEEVNSCVTCRHPHTTRVCVVIAGGTVLSPMSGVRECTVRSRSGRLSTHQNLFREVGSHGVKIVNQQKLLIYSSAL